MSASRGRGRIAIVVSEFPSGSETFVVSRFLGLLDRGWDVHIVCRQSVPSAWTNFPRLSEVDDISDRVHVVSTHSRTAWRRVDAFRTLVRLLLRAPSRILRYVRRDLYRVHAGGLLDRLHRDAALIALQPDVVHFEFGPHALGRTTVGALLGCGVLVSFQGYDLNYAGLDEDPHFFEEIWQRADVIHVVSADLWARALVRGCPPGKAHAVIPPVVDLSMFVAADRPRAGRLGTVERPLRVLCVGRLHWKKGLEYGLEAIRRLEARSISTEVRIVGSGPFNEGVVLAIDDLDLAGSVRLVGPLPPAGVREEMKWADVLLHPAVSEGFCLVALEAQAMGVPVVATDADGLSENVGDAGFIVARRDPEALARRLENLAADAELRERMGMIGRSRAIELFSPDRSLDGFEAVYRSIFDARKEARNHT